MCHCGEVVSHRDASWDDPFHSCRKPSWSHPNNAWGIPVCGTVELGMNCLLVDD
ncbi:hypothetical protein I79_008260 [Cricetulus griseus]|uniref:Uncharacterized protein n=1 Tax=Cricetulus griseus TaxID=10029 RepID=G3HCP6_CRIGR|nr:hypothetical protein I79_008260 [Cricetulus griseus]